MRTSSYCGRWLVCVGAGRGAGVAPSDADVVLQYDGSEATAKLCRHGARVDYA